MRAMSSFSYKDGQGTLHQIPVMYGDPNRQAANVLKKNSENSIPSAPFIACYIKSLEYDQTRLQDPTFVSKVHIRERSYDETTKQYVYNQGAGYTVERIMPSPYKLTFNADIWTTNTDQKLQIIEQLAYLFNPSLEIQTTDNYIDWTSLTVLQLKNTVWSTRQIPQGTEQNIDIGSLTFETPIWITPPAKVKKLGIITKIIANIFNDDPNTIATNYSEIDAVYENIGTSAARNVVTPGNFDLLVLNNVGTLLVNQGSSGNNYTSLPNGKHNWYSFLDQYPGQFKAGLSYVTLTAPSGFDIVAYISIDAIEDTKIQLNFDPDTLPSNTVISAQVGMSVISRGTVDAIVNPETFAPNFPTPDTRYLILENINQISAFSTSTSYKGPTAWKNSDQTNFQAHANDIIQWDGEKWNVIFDSTTTTQPYYITNVYTGVQYVWQNSVWSKSYEGAYSPSNWSLVL
jgi:hypothetical protein